ncbi:MAG: hypothetical protein V4530_00060 [Pseudomonadota bacterium]
MSFRKIVAMFIAVSASLLVAIATPAIAQEELNDGPKSLVIQYKSSLTNRAAFRTYLSTNMKAKLQAMKARGDISDFRIFYSWYRQPNVWDGMVIVRFPTFEGVTKWNALERATPGGLDAAGQALGDPVVTYNVDLSWSRNPDNLREGEVYYVIPYEYRDANEYRDYVKGYILPQFDGWMKDGALTGYELYLNRYSTGLPWDALFIQHYRDMASFGQRQKLTEHTRVGLRQNPEWKAWSDKKQGIRTESENTIAELIAH